MPPFRRLALLLLLPVAGCSSLKEAQVISKGHGMIVTDAHPRPAFWADVRGEDENGHKVSKRISMFESDWNRVNPGDKIAPEDYSVWRFTKGLRKEMTGWWSKVRGRKDPAATARETEKAAAASKPATPTPTPKTTPVPKASPAPKATAKHARAAKPQAAPRAEPASPAPPPRPISTSTPAPRETPALPSTPVAAAPAPVPLATPPPVARTAATPPSGKSPAAAALSAQERYRQIEVRALEDSSVRAAKSKVHQAATEEEQTRAWQEFHRALTNKIRELDRASAPEPAVESSPGGQ